MKKLILELDKTDNSINYKSNYKDVSFFRLLDVPDNQENQFKLYELVKEGVLGDPGQNGEFESFDQFIDKIYYRCYWDRRDSQFIVAVDNNWIGLSSITLDRDKKVADCGLNVVKEEFRGNGIASMLKEKTIDYAKKQGIQKMITNVHEENYSMLAVNQRFGFHESK
ncbi:GNAT family N-acetyltransferase [Shimazuella sp. AN120528]|uniref:GNAT family N-acetyltransferase n=1 Tax=Shimazuella soli TaxID=1892854 RepID=UPI001F10805E|nr:GNAT family N-acetyltransferase [Shimazuella soli]MCH5586069.1 GNAT family N-acetyltransferase [Shimazuella soli]